MSDIVTIRPKKNSKKFTSIEGVMTQFQNVDVNGKEEVRASGEYKGERFPNSRQMFRPIWSRSKSRWLLNGFTGEITEEKQAALNKLVSACKFQYSDNHPNRRQYITKADLFDDRDPFFNHRRLKVISSEGSVNLNKTTPLDKVILLGLLANNEFQKSGEKINGFLSQRVKYIIVDKEIDNKNKRDERNKVLKATSLYGAMSDEKRLSVAMALGIVSDKKADTSLVADILWNYSQDTVGRADGKIKMDCFIEMAEASSDVLNLRGLANEAKRIGALKKNKDGFILYGNPIGKNKTDIISYLANEDNQALVLRLKKDLENNDKG